MLRKCFGALLAEESGAVAPMAILLLPVLLGFCALALDVGTIYANRRFLQNAADAGALAAVREFQSGLINGSGESDSQAAAAASAFAGKNGVSNVVADCPSNGAATLITNARGPLPHSWKVETGRLVHLYFGGWVGVQAQCVRARAVAVVTDLQGTKLWPWSLLKGCPPVSPPETALDPTCGNPSQGSFLWLLAKYGYTKDFLLKQGAGDASSGNYGIVDFDANGGGATTYEDWIYRGFGNGPGEVVPPGIPPTQWDILTDTGNKASANKAYEKYIQDNLAKGCTYGIDTRCALVGLLPIIKGTAWPSGAGKVITVIDFAVFEIDSVSTGATGQMTISGKFLKFASGPGDAGVPDPGGKLSGLTGVRLWQ